jgi:glycosyltransferase involved in cell wall biosynthesis
MNKKILLVGTVSNVAKTIEKELKVVLKALSVFDSVQVFLVESDSTDETVKILDKIASKNRNFEFVALEKLKNKYPHRIARIAYCRNVYVKHIRDNNAISKWDYVAVADLDGMNFKLRAKGIQSCFETNIDWDGVMANQSFGYYDLYALRAPGWVEGDCFEELEVVKKNSIPPKQSRYKLLNFFRNFRHFDKLRNSVIYERMRVLPKKYGFIKVQSAFGGFAIYKSDIFLSNNYDNPREDKIISEQVTFHLNSMVNELKFFINPELINNSINVYNLNRFKVIRFFRELKKFILQYLLNK